MEGDDSLESKFPPCRKLEFIDDTQHHHSSQTINEDTDIELIGASSSNKETDINSIHPSIPKEEIPQVGMEFDSEEAAGQFYLAYAKKVGFGTRKSKLHKDKNGKIIDRTFCCSAEGKRGADKRDVNVKIHRSETRFGCLAKMKISCSKSEKYRVIEFIPEHNHYLCSPHKTHLFRAHRRIHEAHVIEIDMANSVGIAPKASHEFMVKQAGGRDNLGFIPEDYRNYLRSKRTRDMKIGDTGGVLEYLQGMQLEDPNFFYSIQVDKDDLMTNIFWANARMKVDYADFGDVVCFDTTYRKNCEGRSLALFVGVNHHKQTIIFGAALLYDEIAPTFERLFDVFASTMSGKMPKTILTDHDAAMAKALASRWPETQHRLCIWHLYQNAAIHLSGVFEKFTDFAGDFGKCIYDFEEEDIFVTEWDKMLQRYNLQDND